EQFGQVLDHLKEQVREDLAAKGHQLNGVFRELARDGFADIYGENARKLNETQEAARERVIRRAVAIRRELLAEGEYISLDEAVQVAHAGINRKAVAARAEQR